MSDRIDLLNLRDGYVSPPRKIGLLAKMFPTAVFYRYMLREVFLGSKNGKTGKLTEEAYYRNAVGIFRAAERVGAKIEITGYDKVPADGWPYVFVANHMSVLETFLFAAIMYPKGEHNFVVKKSLTEYPVFKHIMHGLDPVVVGRENPRHDLTHVLTKGTEKLHNGQSMIIFPQRTRTAKFQPDQFNTIGIKLARRAGVRVVPVALKTDFWGQGKLVKDFGGIFPQKSVHFHFGAPMEIVGKGQQEHEYIVKFIGRHVSQWETQDSSNEQA